MRKTVCVILGICVFVLLVVIFSEPIILSIAKWQLERTFIGSNVSIKECNVALTQYINLNGIEINRQGEYNIKIDSVRISYALSDLFRKTIPGVYLNNVKAIEIGLNRFKGFGLDIEDMRIALEPGQERQLFIGKIKYNKLSLKDIKATVRLSGKDLFLSNFLVQALNGEIAGNSQFVLDKKIRYAAKLHFVNLDLDKFVNDFELKEKFEINGRLGGDMVIEGSGYDINVLNGDFLSMGDGGVLIIKDSRFMENIANYSRQSLDIIVESFKNYHYNKGLMKMSLEKGDIVFNVILDGQEGKRNLNIFLHDFNKILRREK